MRTRLIITMVLACTLLACSVVTRPDEPIEPSITPPALPPPTGNPPAAGSGANPYFGEESIKERIAYADIVVRARLSTTTMEVITGKGEGWSDTYHVALKLHLTVSEYLKGSGATNITAFTVQGGTYDTQSEGEDAAPEIAVNRISTWDDREAILFLHNEDPNDIFSAAVQGANDYFLTIGGLYQDMYSLRSPYRKLWLPSAGTSATGDDREFLLAAPEPGQDTPTITLRELKSRIAAIDAEMNAGDGSEAYKNCIAYKYRVERIEQHGQSEGRKIWARAALDTHSLVSGSPAGTVIFESDVLGIYPDRKMRTTLEGGDAYLFETVDGPATPWDWNRDGVLTDGIDSIQYTQTLRPVRPIPAGEYSFTVKDLEPELAPCNAFLITEWTVTATAPEVVLHEAFFDPVAVGNAVAADGANGVLNPASFTDRDGAPATIESISWEAGAVKVRVVPWSSLTRHVLNFIELDGTTSLSLNLANSSVHTGNDTLTWSVASQPWEDGDKLMVRIREAPPFANPPGLLTAAASGADAVDLSWDPVSGVSGYHVQRRESGEEAWASVDAGVTGTNHTVSGLSCETDYEFRVGAYGDGTRYDTRTVTWSGTATATTGTCMPQRPPVFSTSTYAFSVGAEAATGTPVGVVSATDPDGGAVSYSIAAGNDAGVFAIATSTGEISVAKPLLSHAATHTLTVRAVAADGDAATVGVAITVASVCGNGVVVPNPDANPALLGDCVALYYGVRQKLAGTGTLNWGADTALASWRGVSVGGEPRRVRGLRLEDAGLDGVVPAELGLLSELSRIDLSDNSLSGEIPSELGKLSKLEDLDLEYNRLSGGIPTVLGTLKGMRRLSLSANRLTGEIPAELGGLARLATLDLAQNGLSGGIPVELSHLPAIQYLSLGSNALTGAVPTQLGGLSTLHYLYLDDNDLTGGIPVELGSLSELRLLSLGGNGLSGGIPAVLGGLTRLEELSLRRNALTGEIPASLGKLGGLEYLYLSGNALTGCVPAALRRVANNDLVDLGLADCPNRAPVFSTSTYAFSVSENAATTTRVGAVSATDPDEDSITYTITAGNEGGVFAIGSATGVITVAGALDRQTAASHTLTVQAADGNGGVATATVVVSVTDPG